jgi:hypothetical protein
LQADAYLEKPFGLPELEQFARRVQQLMEIRVSEPRTVAA